jgi:hypothetical protein
VTWDLHVLEVQLPGLGTLAADFCLAQDGTWVYSVSLASTITHRNHPPRVMTTHPATGYNEYIQPTQGVVLGLSSNLDTW